MDTEQGGGRPPYRLIGLGTSGPSSEWSGRAVFGIGAVIADVVVAWLLVRGARGAFHRRER